MERSSLSDRRVFIPFYSLRYMESFETQLLYDLDGIMNLGKLLPDIVVYVKTKPEKIYERLKRSGTSTNFTLDDLKDLDFLYEEFVSRLKSLYKIPVVFRIDGNKSLSEIQNEDLKELEPIFEKLLWSINDAENEKLDCRNNEKSLSSWDYYIPRLKKSIYNLVWRKIIAR